MKNGEEDPPASKSKITLLLVEDQGITRLGLKIVLNRCPDFELIGEAENGKDAVEQAQKLKPSVVMMDINMPVLNGIEATQSIKAALPDIKVIILTMSDEDDAIFAALSAGADGYCLKDAQPEVLAAAIRSCDMGASWLDPAIAKRVLRASSGNKSSPTASATAAAKDNLFALTERELDVLQQLVEGLSNQEIAEKLCITLHTVKSHMRHIMEKLMVSDRTQVAVKALKDGLLKPG